jgi:hypothetical protein
MKNFKVSILSIATVMTTIASCTKADFPTPESENIVGEWEWIESRGGLSGNAILTPETQSETRQLEFKENGKYRECIDDKRVDKGDFSMEEKSDSWGNYYLLKLEGKNINSESHLTFKTSDTLSLFPVNCADCFTSTYVRK